MISMIIGAVILVVCALILEYADHKGLKNVKNYTTFGADLGLCLSAAGSVTTMGWGSIIYMILIARFSHIVAKLLFRAYLDTQKEKTV